ncbi:enoyl-CoA hydratase/isomerase family protein [bacterium]|nr:enoyl-CoA hydratase/isomerase family protein [bacterium]
MSGPYVTTELGEDHVGVVRLCQPPNNFFSLAMIESVADALEAFDTDRSCRSVVLAAEGKHFCAGADFASPATYSPADLYAAAVRLFRTSKPIVAAVQGAAIGGGLGVALSADFRIATPQARFSANFARLGFHHGFGLSVTLPGAVGQQRAAELLYTGRRIDGDEAATIGLVDRVVPTDLLESAALSFAAEIAASAPLAVQSIRATLRADLADRVAAATDRELTEQERLRHTDDFIEGTRAMAERRTPNFTGVEQ